MQNMMPIFYLGVNWMCWIKISHALSHRTRSEASRTQIFTKIMLFFIKEFRPKKAILRVSLKFKFGSPHTFWIISYGHKSYDGELLLYFKRQKTTCTVKSIFRHFSCLNLWGNRLNRAKITFSRRNSPLWPLYEAHVFDKMFSVFNIQLENSLGVQVKHFSCTKP